MSMAVPLYMFRSTEVAMRNFSDSDDAAAVPDMSGMPNQLTVDDHFLLQGPLGTFCSNGVQRMLFQDSIEALGSRCATVLGAIGEDKNAAPFLVGALPFERTASCWLYQPRAQLFTVNEVLATSCLRVHSVASTEVSPSLRMEPDREVYQEMVRQATIRLRRNHKGAGALRKVVLARSLMVDRGTPFDMDRLLQRLMEDASVTTYCLPLPACAISYASRYLAGATPELLISRRGSRIESHPLAGSMPRRSQPELDRDASYHLMQSEKDRAEHRVVVEFIADLLSPLCSDLHVPATPSLRATRSMWHLGTHMTGTLKHPDDMDTSSSLAIAARLQPTPALCGAPRDPALDLIRQLEPFERGFYGGAVGWSDATGNGDWHVAIRCAEVQGGRARLYAGAGIMHDSDPRSEADETAAKFNAMIHALELERVLGLSPQTLF
jgi:isochorismate synthase